MPSLLLGDTRLIIDTCKARKVSLPQCAYILATAYWETGRTMKPVREAFWLSEQWRKTNLRYYPYYGRGYVQLTWLANYEKVGKLFGFDAVNYPDKVMQPNYAARILVQGMMEGWFTGKKLSDYVNTTSKDYLNARRVVNGTDKAREIADLAVEYEKALISNGYSTPLPAPYQSLSGVWAKFLSLFKPGGA